MKPTGYQRKDIQGQIRKARAERIAAGVHPQFFADKPKPIDVEKEREIMQKIRYD